MVYVKQLFTKCFEKKFQGPYKTLKIENNTVTYSNNDQIQITNIRKTKLVKIKHIKSKIYVQFYC